MPRRWLQMECALEVVSSQLYGKSSFKNGCHFGKYMRVTYFAGLPVITLDARRATGATAPAPAESRNRCAAGVNTSPWKWCWCVRWWEEGRTRPKKCIPIRGYLWKFPSTFSVIVSGSMKRAQAQEGSALSSEPLSLLSEEEAYFWFRFLNALPLAPRSKFSEMEQRYGSVFSGSNRSNSLISLCLSFPLFLVPSPLSLSSVTTGRRRQPPAFRCAWGAASFDVQFRLRLLLAEFLHEFLRVIIIADINI
jgi:hypothetical protein